MQIREEWQPAVLPAWGPRQRGGICVVRDGETKRAKQVDTQEVSAMMERFEGECSKVLEP